jgi:hypothetical protein
MRRPVLAALACGAVLMVVAVVVALSGRDFRVLDSNHIGNGVFVAEIPAGGRGCQGGEVLLRGTGRVRLTMADRGRPTDPVTVRFSSGGRTLAQGALPAGWKEGEVAVPLDRVIRADTGDVRWCVLNRGRVPVLVAGQPGFDATSAVVDGEAVGARMRAEYLTREPRSWWSQVGAVADRFSFGRARHFSGTWPLWAGLALLLAAWAVTVRIVLRLAAEEA